MCITTDKDEQKYKLNRPLDLDEVDESLWNDKCDYLDLETCSNLNPNNYNLLVLQLNIRSLLVHQLELNQLKHMTEKKNSWIDLILLCETFLSKQTVNMVNVPGFTHIDNYRKNKKGGGVSILIREGISFKCRQDLEVFEEGQTGSVFIEILNKNGRKIILGSLYRPPNTGIEQFSDHLIDIINRAKRPKGGISPELVLGMDHNIDLLMGKQHAQTHKFIEDLSRLDILPIITRSSRITSHSATLIDNIYVSEQLHRSFESAILMSDISDHLPILAMFKQTKLLNKEPLSFKSRCLNETKLKVVNHHLMEKDWIGLLNCTTSSMKFDQFGNMVNAVLDHIALEKVVKISAKCHYVEPWMTRGLEEASKTKHRLYKASLKRDRTNEDTENYRHHRNLYNKLKRKLKTDYYQLRCDVMDFRKQK